MFFLFLKNVPFVRPNNNKNGPDKVYALSNWNKLSKRESGLLVGADGKYIALVERT